MIEVNQENRTKRSAEDSSECRVTEKRVVESRAAAKEQWSLKTVQKQSSSPTSQLFSLWLVGS